MANKSAKLWELAWLAELVAMQGDSKRLNLALRRWREIERHFRPFREPTHS